jgi:hypothetical protein
MLKVTIDKHYASIEMKGAGSENVAKCVACVAVLYEALRKSDEGLAAIFKRAVMDGDGPTWDGL